MMIVNTDFISGKQIETLGLVRAENGSGKLRVDEAINEMKQKAKEMGADAIICYRSSSYYTRLMVSGTAVKYV